MDLSVSLHRLRQTLRRIKFRVLSTIERIKTLKISLAIIASQELSRKIVSWTLYPIKLHFPLKLPQIVQEFLSYPFIYLAGGALTTENFYLRKFDYDLFFVGHPAEILDFIEKIRKHHNYYESANAITIDMESIQIQFIKRIYASCDQVIGGFDNDLCRVILINGVVYTTASGIATRKQKYLVANLNCQSRSYISRMQKYSQRFLMDIINPYDLELRFRRRLISSKIIKSDYSVYIDNNPHTNRQSDLRQNIVHMIRGNYDSLYIRYNSPLRMNNEMENRIGSYPKLPKKYGFIVKVNGEYETVMKLPEYGPIFEYADFERYLGHIEKAERMAKQIIGHHFFIPSSFANPSQFRKRIVYINDINYSELLAARIKMVKRGYKRYQTINTIRTRDVMTQFTGSNFVTNYSFEKFCFNYRPIKIEHCGAIMAILLYRMIPKPLRIKIALLYINDMLTTEI